MEKAPESSEVTKAAGRIHSTETPISKRKICPHGSEQKAPGHIVSQAQLFLLQNIGL